MSFSGFQQLYQHIKFTDPRLFDTLNKISDNLMELSNQTQAANSIGIDTYLQLNIPRGLGANNKGLVIRVDKPYNHLLLWDGNKWHFLDSGSNYIALFRAAPTGEGWQLCDGSNIDFLKSDGSLSSLFNVDNLVANPSFLKAAAAYTGALNAATVPVFNGSALANHQHEIPFYRNTSTNTYQTTSYGTGSAQTTIGNFASTAFVGSGATELTQAKSAGTPAGTVALPADPIANLNLLPYFRR